MPDAELMIGELKSVVELSEVGRHTVTHQLDVGHKLTSDVMVE